MRWIFPPRSVRFRHPFFPRETCAIGLPGDTVFDGVVDIDDLNAIRNTFGTHAVAPIPEPAACVLWCGGLLSIAAKPRRRR